MITESMLACDLPLLNPARRVQTMGWMSGTGVLPRLGILLPRGPCRGFL